MISKTTTKSKKFKEIEKKDGTTHKDRHYRFKTTYNKYSKSTKRKIRHNIRQPTTTRILII